MKLGTWLILPGEPCVNQSLVSMNRFEWCSEVLGSFDGRLGVLEERTGSLLRSQ